MAGTAIVCCRDGTGKECACGGCKRRFKQLVAGNRECCHSGPGPVTDRGCHRESEGAWHKSERVCPGAESGRKCLESGFVRSGLGRCSRSTACFLQGRDIGWGRDYPKKKMSLIPEFFGNLLQISIKKISFAPQKIRE